MTSETLGEALLLIGRGIARIGITRQPGKGVKKERYHTINVCRQTERWEQE